MYKKMVVFALVVGLSLAGCAMARSPLMGAWYTSVKAPEAATASVGSKSGEACATSLLGIIATGDASIEAAKAAGGITEVSSVDSQATSILGLYAKFCTVVTGK